MQSQKMFGWWVEDSPSTNDRFDRWEDYELETSHESGGVGNVYPVRAKPYVAKLFKENMLSLYNQNDIWPDA